MSGKKVSLFDLVLDAQDKFTQCRLGTKRLAELAALKVTLGLLLDAIRAGHRSAEPTSIARAEEWLRQVAPPSTGTFTMDADQWALDHASADLKSMLAEGKEIASDLVHSASEHHDDQAATLGTTLMQLETTLIANKELLRRWDREAIVKRVELGIATAKEFVDQARFVELEVLLGKLDEMLAPALAESEELERKHQQRLYLLKAVRQACADMGFEEEAPAARDAEDRGSPIDFEVDTVDQGKIAFSLALEEITCFSEISDARCFGEFDEITRYLEEEYGVRTSFTKVDGERPVLLEKDEKDLPEDIARSAEAGRG